MSRQRVLPGQQAQQQQQYREQGNSSGFRTAAAGAGTGGDDQFYEQPQQAYQEQRRGSGPANHARPGSSSSSAQLPSSNGHHQTSPPRSGAPNARSGTKRPQQVQSNGSRDGSGAGQAPSRRAAPFQIDEEANTFSMRTVVLKEYGLSTLQPDVWEDTNPSDGGPVTPGLGGGPASRSRGSQANANADEPDPLGLYRGSVFSNIPELPPDVRNQILMQSKAFDASIFLSQVHPAATKDDLAYGRERLNENIESRSAALHRLVEDNLDRFVGVKQATHTVYEEMKSGPLSEKGDYAVRDLRESLKLAQDKADAVWNPILEARAKADRLRSTLGVFERSKFFFTLPGVLSEAIAANRYDAALAAYKKGRYLLDSRSGALLGLPPGVAMTEQQREKHRRVFEKVWSQVENIMGDLRSTLGKRLRDPRRGLEDVEKTIEILLELDPASDPVWIYFDTQHHHIMQALRAVHERYNTKFRNVLSKMVPPSSLEDTARAADLRTCLLAVETPSQDLVLAKATGSEVYTSLGEIVHHICEVLLQTIPNFWKVGKAYMDGKYSRKDGPSDRKKSVAAGMMSRNESSSGSGGKRSPTQVNVMLNEIVNLFITLFSEFFGLSSHVAMSPRLHDGSGQEGNLPPLPAFIPGNTNALTAGTHLLKALAELSDCTNDIGALPAMGIDVQNSLKEFMSTTKYRFLEAICAVWVRDAKIFWRLEDWTLDSEELSRTIYLKRIETYLRNVARLAYRASGGNEERASNLFVEGKGVALLRRMGNENIPSTFAKKIHTTYLDALYDFLDGMVHVAFLEKAEVTTAAVISPVSDQLTPLSPEKAEQVDVRERDVRILLTVSNLSHFKSEVISKVADQLQTALKIEMSSDSKTLHDVVGQLDKILFDDYVKGRSVVLAKTIEKGVLGNGIDWLSAPKPTAVHPYIYDALLSLVMVHAQITAIARSLVTRTIGSLVEEVAKHALSCFSKVRSFGMGGMLQATLEMEFLHQTLNTHVSPSADATLQEIYKIISAAYKPANAGGEANELQRELEQLKLTLTQARRATALQFLCFREKRAQAVAPSAAGQQGSQAGSTVPRSR